MIESDELQILRDLVQAHLAVDRQTLQILPIATGKHNSSYWVESDQGRFVLRLAPPDDTGFLFYERLMMRQEPALHALIRSRTTIPVAEIVAYDWSRTRIDRDYVLMTALPGTPLTAAELTQQQLAQTLVQVGTALRALHALTAPTCLGISAYGYLGAHRPMEPQPTWADAFRVMWHKLLDDVTASGCYSPREAQGLRDLLDRHHAHFAHPVTPSLLHMDVWGQNILVDTAGNLTGLVDLDRALWGDVECEFAVLDYCSISAPSFWQGYGIDRDQSPAALIRRQFYVLYEVQKYMPICVWRRHDLAAARRYKAQSFLLAERLGFQG